MKINAFFTVTTLVVLSLALPGCATDKGAAGKPALPQATLPQAGLPQVTVPNGSSPAKANAPRAPMYDSEENRSGWNHGNSVLWVSLRPQGIFTPDDVEKDGSLRVKFGWWRAVQGEFVITGRRLDAPAPPLRYKVASVAEAGAIGFTPGYLYFPTVGYWEITGRIDDHESLTFVIHVIEAGVTIPNGRSPATDNAPLAPMNDSEANRKGWNHGNGVLWVFLRPTAYVPDMVEKDGSLRVKSGWWKGFSGKFTVDGRRLDAPAPPLRCTVNDEPLDDVIGPIPAVFHFPTEGYWEITGHLNGKSLTFVIQVINATVPNGSSPAKANAPHAPENDTDAMRTAWNHGNGVLWVNLSPRGEVVISDNERENDGSFRVKFPWSRGVRGQLTVDGRRLDLPAPPLRYEAASIAQNGDIGLNPCLLFFPTDGYWEITGHVGDKSLTFVIHVIKEAK